MAILSVSGLRKSFGALQVTDDVTFDVPEGDALGIIGPNGAGKSTLFDLITGRLRPDGGTIVFAGEDVTSAPPMRRCQAGIGRSFQIPQPFAKLTVFENLLVAGAFGQGRGEEEVAGEAERILAETGMLAKADLLAGDLGLLDRKRLELARAMATKPKLLLLDEIAGGLTDAECGELTAVIKAIHAGGATIVWIEHVLHALTAVVEDLLVLNFGQVLARGEPAQIMDSPEVRSVYLGLEA